MKKKLPKILFVSGLLMPIIMPIYIVISFGQSDVNILRGIYFGIMLGIAFLVISKVLKIREKMQKY